MLCGPTQDGRVIVESTDKTWSTGGKKDKLIQYTCLENPMNSMKREKDMTPKVEPRWSEGVHYVTEEEQRNSSRKKEEAGPKWKQHSVVDVSGDESKVLICKEQYCIGTWNVRSTNQGKLDVVKQEKARVNIDILVISELKLMGIGEFNSGDPYICYCGQESLRRN